MELYDDNNVYKTSLIAKCPCTSHVLMLVGTSINFRFQYLIHFKFGETPMYNVDFHCHSPILHNSLIYGDFLEHYTTLWHATLSKKQKQETKQNKIPNKNYWIYLDIRITKVSMKPITWNHRLTPWNRLDCRGCHACSRWSTPRTTTNRKVSFGRREQRRKAGMTIRWGPLQPKLINQTS